MEMNEEQTSNVEMAEAGYAGSATRPIEDLLKRLGPHAVFGEPVVTDRVTIIPVAEVRTGFGFGGGEGRSASPQGEEGGGFGGGGSGRVVPRGYIRIMEDRVHFEPIVDVTRLALTAMTLGMVAAVIIGGWFARDE